MEVSWGDEGSTSILQVGQVLQGNCSEDVLLCPYHVGEPRVPHSASRGRALIPQLSLEARCTHASAQVVSAQPGRDGLDARREKHRTGGADQPASTPARIRDRARPPAEAASCPACSGILATTAVLCRLPLTVLSAISHTLNLTFRFSPETFKNTNIVQPANIPLSAALAAFHKISFCSIFDEIQFRVLYDSCCHFLLIVGYLKE